ncbi:carbohydrate kinase family protein [Streptomyces sp. MB09-01]|uniref:carbohydrate kinase family protein n=1 Tax=Streptomyces sp. MB09-01 TaxID=3028666 RepID=UPI0029BA2AAD|nr:carbohydrate kinase family protein [Streptomyces sp. MB09-01]MDX3535895.1 carbohydrate kinase family protein [Streptomyces sp. MB09-01]
MRIAVSGSIATDHLMVFPGSFTDQLIQDRLDKISLSFLVDDLEIRHGGVAANISYGLGGLGQDPVLVGAAGSDFAEYRTRLKEQGVDTDFVHISSERQTARFMCLTDREEHQIASFYSGAMAEAAGIDLQQVVERAGDVGAVVISPNDPAAMLRHTDQARSMGIAFAADPSQQLARLDRDEARHLVTGARWLFTNEYEASLLQERTGWRRADILSRAGVWLTTLGERGVRMEAAGEPVREVPAVPPAGIADPTGAGDAFRAGFMAAVSWGEGLEPAARVGCAVASFSLEALGAQGYALEPAALLQRLEDSYGVTSARAIAPHLQRGRR